MHNELPRRFLAARGSHLRRLVQIESATQAVGQVTGNDFTLTAPITFTVIASPPPQTTVISPPNSSSTTLPPPITSSIASLSSSSTTPSASLSASSPPYAAVPPTQPSSSEPAGATQVSPASEDSGKASKSKAMPAGNIAAIVVILVLALLIVISVTIIRKVYIRKRMRKRATWTGGIMGKPVSSADYGFGGGTGASNFEKPRRIPVPVYNHGDSSISPDSDFTFTRNQALQQQSLITPPPVSYNNPSPSTMTMSMSSPMSGSSTGLRSPSFLATVQCTFIPSLPDELTISTGDTLRVLDEYDDGWALCANGNGEQGMVPLECLDRLESGLGTSDPRLSRRVSSLAAGGRY